MRRELSPLTTVIIVVVLAAVIAGGALWVWLGPSARPQGYSGFSAPTGTPQAAQERRQRGKEMFQEMFGRGRQNRQSTAANGGGAGP